jgi:peptide/nickel transport system permease protein
VTAPVFSFVAHRLAAGILLLWAVSALIFVGTEMLPGDAAQAILGQSATPEALSNLRRELGLDRPPLERYATWMGRVLTGDFGRSLANREDVATLIGKRLANTAILAGAAAMVTVPLALALGMVCVLYRDRFLDRAVSFASVAAISMPEFFVGYVLILCFSVRWRLFPTMANVHVGMTVAEWSCTILLPTAALVLVTAGHILRMTRAAILDVMSSPYIEMAELKGIHPRRIVWRHALPNAVAPIVNVVVFNLAYLVVGVVVVEVVFSYPGLGSLMVDHVAARDIPVVQACGLIFAGTYIGLNIVADLISSLANPRLRHP